MNIRHDWEAPAFWLLLARIAGLLTAIIGALVLLGWTFDITTLKSLAPGWVAMKTNTALGFFCAGIALMLNVSTSARHHHGKRISARALATLVTLVGAITFYEHLLQTDLGIDQLLFDEPANTIGTLSPNRMAPLSALLFIFSGTALLMTSLPNRFPRLIPLLALMIILPALAAGFIYLYRTDNFYGLGYVMQLAAHSVLAFLLLGSGILFSRPEQGIVAQLRSRDTGGTISRRVLPVAILVPMLLGGLKLYGEHHQWYEPHFGVALAALLYILLFCAMVLWAARFRSRADAERELAATTIAASEARLRTLLRTLPDLVWLKDPQGNYLACNHLFEHLYGVKETELIGKSDYDFVDREQAEFFRAHDQEVIAAGVPRSNEEWLTFADNGRRFLAETTKAPVYNENGELMGVLGIARDITAHHQSSERLLEAKEEAQRLLAEANQTRRAMLGVLEDSQTTAEALRRSEEQLRHLNDELEQRVNDRAGELQALFDSVSVGIVLAKDRIIVRCNKQLDEIFGYAEGELVGQSARIWYVDDQAFASAVEMMYAQIARGETHLREELMVRKDGSRFWVRIGAHAIDANDLSKGVVGVLEDITVERAAIEEIKNARAVAEEATRMKSEFLANMSHEIRTPMNAILGMLYLALKGDLSPTLYNYLSKARGAAQSLLGIINDILDFSKIESGKLKIESVEFSLDSVLEKLTDSVSFLIGRKDIEFLIRYDARIPSALLGDPLRLGQILLNLCNNAVKFTEQGEVELALRNLSLSASELTLQISVRDTGIGITPEVQERLFQKFTQADQSTTRQFGGTGLGLVITKNLVEMMGGRIWIDESVPDKGTTICCTIQLKVAPEEKRDRDELVSLAGSLLKDIRILVVDDNEAAREILAEMLRRFHIDVSVAHNGPDAISKLEQSNEHPFDLVLMDWRMPGMNGDEVIRRIRANTVIRHHPKMVMATAYGREDVVKLADEANVDGFLIKPVSPSTLLDTTLTVLGRARILSGRTADEEKNNPLPKHDFAGAHLLLVEDNEINREFAAELLQSMNVAVDEAVNGEEAVTKVTQGHYDAVLMDIQMPVMDGLEATRRIRALAQQPGGERFAVLPIIAMTALAMAQDAQNSREAGMNDHLTKPIDPDHLMTTLANWLPVAPQSANTGDKPGAANLPVGLATLQSIDTAQGIRRIGGNVDAYLRQLKRFREHYPMAVDELLRLLKESGVRACEEYCHSLKGVCGNLGADELFAALAALDSSLKQNLTPDQKQFEQLRILLDQVMAEIDALAIPAHPHPLASNALPPEDLLKRLDELTGLLENDLGAAEPLLDSLLNSVAGSKTEQAMNEIAASADGFDIEAALAQTRALRAQLADTAKK